MSVNSIREDEQVREVSKRDTLVRLYSYLFLHKKKLAIVAALVLVTLSVTLTMPLLIERAVDVHVAQRDTEGLLKLALFAVVLLLISRICTRKWMRQSQIGRASCRERV